MPKRNLIKAIQYNYSYQLRIFATLGASNFWKWHKNNQKGLTVSGREENGCMAD